MQYDQLLGAWTTAMPCASQHQVLRLEQFRQLARLPAAVSPSIYQIRYLCEHCGLLHTALTTQEVLDWQPLQGAWPVYHDVMTGKDAWQIHHGQWIQRLIQGRWPLEGWCSHRRRVTGLWPTQLRVIEPDGQQRFTVCFQCPACERLEYESMDSARLVYSA